MEPKAVKIENTLICVKKGKQTEELLFFHSDRQRKMAVALKRKTIKECLGRVPRGKRAATSRLRENEARYSYAQGSNLKQICLVPNKFHNI
ncbi:hypothetical protein NDU88_003496 [Pleurodeles waltl]|uniref:Uncharacterized protein n=1 Tax=Pleurodeles waltl TaxID=8319 RepID=A0AAV7KVQ6_PLEWA|nr:hypothetical protein NDU88_003496 [Pleurodeles waltl]